jgi:perosamine synthetase
MKKLYWRVQRKKQMFALYQSHLENVSEVGFIETNLEDTSPWFIDILVSDPSALREYLKEQGVDSRPFYPPLHSQPPYGLAGEYPDTEYVSAHGLWLPSSSFLTDEDIEYICDAIKNFSSI